MRKINSRERILKALNHKEPDRVPIDIGGSTVTGISAIAYNNLKNYLGIEEGNVRVFEVMQQLVRVEEWFLDRFNIDVLDVGAAYLTNDENWYDVETNGIKMQYPNFFQPRQNPDGSFEIVDEDGTVLGSMSKAALVFDQDYYPYEDGYPEDFTFLSFIKAFNKNAWAKCIFPPFSNMGERRFWKNLRENAIKLRDETLKCIILNFGGGVFQDLHNFRRMDRLIMDTVRNPSKLKKMVDYQIEFHINALKVICKYIGDVVDIIVFGDDLAEKNGPMISPKTYQKFFKYGHEELCDYVKKHSSMKIFFHTCGAVVKLIPDLIEIGIDILNPIQLSAKEMDPKFIKGTFGDDLVLWGGGADTTEVLNRKSPEEVKSHVKELLEIFAPGGGYVWNTVHNILPDVPPENIIAAMDAIEEYNNEN
ncbi:MAG: methyltransferase [Candidatus Lokiarchaeota archaeon]|nr:methyltransferase [Candidatus Lokiarchaeota archaeon]